MILLPSARKMKQVPGIFQEMIIISLISGAVTSTFSSPTINDDGHFLQINDEE
jgi:hypothetical protein